jgi:uncharacterized protein
MILPDVNTLLYAVNRSSDQHTMALKALQRSFDNPRGVAFAWTALLAFLRLSTRRGIFPRPLSVEDALRVVERWLGHSRAQVVNLASGTPRFLGNCSGPPALPEI